MLDLGFQSSSGWRRGAEARHRSVSLQRIGEAINISRAPALAFTHRQLSMVLNRTRFLKQQPARKERLLAGSEPPSNNWRSHFQKAPQCYPTHHCNPAGARASNYQYSGSTQNHCKLGTVLPIQVLPPQLAEPRFYAVRWIERLRR